MKNVTIYTSAYCPFCIRALELLTRKGAPLTQISVDDDPEVRVAMIQKAGSRTVPQIWIGENHIGGCDDLYALENKGQLDNLLRS